MGVFADFDLVAIGVAVVVIHGLFRAFNAGVSRPITRSHAGCHVVTAGASSLFTFIDDCFDFGDTILSVTSAIVSSFVDDILETLWRQHFRRADKSFGFLVDGFAVRSSAGFEDLTAALIFCVYDRMARKISGVQLQRSWAVWATSDVFAATQSHVDEGFTMLTLWALMRLRLGTASTTNRHLTADGCGLIKGNSSPKAVSGQRYPCPA